MIPVATIDQMRECDRYTIEELKLPGLVLMENASRAATSEAIEMLDDDPAGKMVQIFCGKGNNGGDGFAIARHLQNLGAEIELFLIGKTEDLKGDALFNCELFEELDGFVVEVESEEDFVVREDDPDLVIDALLGTGFTGQVSGLYAEAIKIINSTCAPVLAIDIPSGVEGGTGAAAEPAVHADITITFGLLKPGLLLPPGCECCGRVVIADIGIPPQVVDRQKINQFRPTDEDVGLLLPQRHPADHKGDAGHVFIIAGSPGMTGAATLAAEASMRSGAGLTVVGIPHSLNSIIETKLTESMTLPLPENECGCLCENAINLCIEKLEWADVVVFGPGVGRDSDTAAFLARLLEKMDKPLIIDADGLNLLAENPKLIKKLPSNTVLTPHPGEFSRLTGLSTSAIKVDSVELARKWSKKWGVTLILKGAPSLTAIPDGKVIINSTGNAGMATGGSGDVLTGLIASLVAQGLDTANAAWVGCYLHSAAGDLAAKELGQHGMVAGDIVTALPKVIRDFE